MNDIGAVARRAIEEARNGAHAGHDEELDDEADPLEVPPYPLEALGPRLAGFVQAFAAGTEAPPVIAALPALAVIGSALGPRWIVGAPGLLRPPALWLALVAPPGAAKTPTARPVWRPLWTLDARLHEDHEAAREQYAERLAAWESQPKKAKGPRPAAPSQRRRWIITDSTPEGMLRDGLQPGEGYGLLVHSDELAQFLGSLDGYRASGGRSGRGSLLSLWSGARIVSTRAGRDAIEVGKPFAAIFGGAQPNVLQKLELEGGDGLCSRFLFGLAPVQPGGLGPGVGPDVREAWAELVFTAAELGASRAERAYFDAGAEARLNAIVSEWRDLAPQLARAGLGLYAEAVAKAADQVVRMTAALHGADVAAGDADPRDDVPLATLERAESLVRWHLLCARRVAGLVAPAGGEDKLTDRDAQVFEALKRAVRPGEAVELEPAEWAARLAFDATPAALGKALLGIRKAKPSGWLVTSKRDRRRRWRVERLA